MNQHQELSYFAKRRREKSLCRTPKETKFWISSHVGSWRSQKSKTPKPMALSDLFLLLNSSNNLVLCPEPQQSLSSSGLGHSGWELPLLLRENPRFLCSPHRPREERSLRRERGERNTKLENKNTGKWKRGEDDRSSRKPVFSMMLKSKSTKRFGSFLPEVFESVTINLMNLHRHRGCDPKNS